jgi:hypothetical protein
MSPAAVRSVADVSEVPPPDRRARVAAYASALSAVIGFVPLHMVWALGIPLFADKQRFATWYVHRFSARCLRFAESCRHLNRKFWRELATELIVRSGTAALAR